MWFTRKSTEAAPHPPAARAGCRHTLVLHADGTQECEGERGCGCDELLHEWWVGCDELGCGCTGEEHDLVLTWADAA